MIGDIVELAAYFHYSSERSKLVTNVLVREELSIASSNSQFIVVVLNNIECAVKQVQIRVQDLHDKNSYIDFIMLNPSKKDILKKLEHEFDING